MIHKPTRITSYSATLLDNILINSLHFEITGGLLISDISDRFPSFQFIHTLGICTSEVKTTSRRKLNSVHFVKTIWSLSSLQLKMFQGVS